MTLRSLTIAASLLLAPIALSGQGKGIDPAQLLKPLADQWPTYSGDLTGRRYSALTDVNRLTVKTLTLGWVATVRPGPGGAERLPNPAANYSVPRKSLGVFGPGQNDLLRRNPHHLSPRTRPLPWP